MKLYIGTILIIASFILAIHTLFFINIRNGWGLLTFLVLFVLGLVFFAISDDTKPFKNE
jgi:hypothetical protein